MTEFEQYPSTFEDFSERCRIAARQLSDLIAESVLGEHPNEKEESHN